MPRYFFHVKDGATFIDKDGTDLPDHDAAKTQAVGVMSEILRNESRSKRSADNWAMHVIDETGETVCRMRFITDSSPIGKVRPFQIPEATLH